MTTPNNETDLMEVQIGTQSAFATAVTPTAKLMGIQECTLSPGVSSSAVEENRGSLVPAYNVTLDKISGGGKITGDASYEQLGYFLDTTFGQATPSGTPTFTRAYAAPIATKPVSRMLTVVKGSAEGSYGLTGGIGNEFNLKVASNERAKIDQGLIGHSVLAKALATLSDISPKFLHANQMTMFIDAWGGTMGGTALTDTMFSAELAVNMNKALKFGLGSVNPKDTSQKKLAVDGNSLKLAVEFSATQTKAYLTDILASSPLKLQVRLLFTYDVSNTFQIDFAGWQKEAPEIFPDTDGVASFELNLAPLYHTTLANWLKLTLLNQVATLS